jgi:hypothetical protein
MANLMIGTKDQKVGSACSEQQSTVPVSDPEPRKSLVELYRADIEEDRAEALVCYAFVIAEENTATGRHNQPTKVVVLAGVGRVTLLLLSEYDTLNVN